MGKRGNIAEVFGDICWKMALPVFSSFGDGLTYPQRFVEDPEMGLNNGLHNSTSRQPDLTSSQSQIALIEQGGTIKT